MKINQLLQGTVLPALFLLLTATPGTCQDQTPLTLAVIKGDVRLAKQLLAQGEEINRTNGFGFTPLMLAAARGNNDMVVALLAEGADANFKREGCTALYWAAHYGEPDLLKNLIKGGADINAKADNGLTPVMEAAVWGKLENVQTLQSAGAVFTNDLVYASAFGQLDIVKERLKDGANVSARNESGWTPLAAAAANGHLTVVNFLLERGADVDSDGKDGSVTESALIFAVQAEKIEIVKALLSKKASLKPDSEQRTALFVAVDSGFLDGIKCLLDHGADPNGHNPNGQPVLFTAAQKHAEAVKVLLDGGADVNATNIHGSTALIIASDVGNADSVLMLLSKGARVSTKYDGGLTALQLAQSRGYERIVEILSNPDEAVKNASDFKTEKPNARIDSNRLTKAEWKEKVRPYYNRGGGVKVITASNFKAIFGQPSKAQTDGNTGHAYWFYSCSDGEIQIDLIDPNVAGGIMAIISINDY